MRPRQTALLIVALAGTVFVSASAKTAGLESGRSISSGAADLWVGREVDMNSPAGLRVGSEVTQKPQPGNVIQVAIANVAFAPTDIKATVGDTIEWTNKDIFDHTSTARNKAWNLTVPTGKKVSVVMKTAGTVQYYCTFHPNMTGQIVVAAKPAK